MANAMTYIANLGKSVTYSTIDRLKNMNPALTDFADQNEELGRVLYESVKDFKGTSRKAAKYISQSSVGEFAKEYKKAFFEDIKTGKFYNKEREDTMNTKAAGGLLDDYDPFADMDAIENTKFDQSKFDQMSEDDKHVSKMMDTVGGKVTNGVAMATARSAEFQVEAYRDGLNKQQKHAEYLTNKINTGIAGVNSTIANLVEFNNKAMKVHIENSRNFYTEMTNLTRENNKLLQQIVKYNASLYDAQQEEQKAKSSTSRFSDIVSGGMPSLKAYGKNVLNNLDAASGGMLGMNKMFGEDSNILLTMAASPFKFIPEFIAKKIIPNAIEQSVKGLNETLSGLFAGTMLKMNEARNDFETPDMLQKVLEVFGINMGVKSKSSIATNKYKKGPLPWDGEAKMALTRVIPDYLAKILAATTGASEKFFDYETGKYRDISDLNDQVNNLTRKYSDSAASEIIEYMKDEIKKINFSGQKENYDRLIEDMHNMFETAYSNGQIIRFNKKNPEKIDYYKMGITEDSAKILIPLLQNIVAEDGLNKRHMLMSYNRKILENRDAQNNYMKGIENNSTSLMRNLNNNIGFNEYVNTVKYNNSDKRHIITDVRDLTERQLRTNKNPNLINNIYLVKDEYNKNIFWYLQRFAQEFATIRTKGVSVNNISGGGDYTPSSSSTTLLDENEAGISKREMRRRIKANNEARRQAETDRRELVGTSVAIGGIGYKSLRSEIRKNTEKDEEYFNRNQSKNAERTKNNWKDNPTGYMLANDEFYEEDLKKSMAKYSAYLKTDADFRKFQATSKDNREKYKKYKNSLIGSIMESDDVDTRFKNIVMGVDELSHKPAEFLAGIIGKVDKRLFDIVYGDEDDDKLSPRSFMGNLIARLTSTFGNFGDFVKDEVLDPLKETLFGNQEDSFKNKMKDFFKDENVKEFLKNAFGDKIQFVKDAFKEKWGDFMNLGGKDKSLESDKLQYAQDIAKQAQSENAIRAAREELGGSLPPGATFKLDENGMPIRNSKGGYEFTVDPKQLANKARRINNFTYNKSQNIKEKKDAVLMDVGRNHTTNGLYDTIQKSKKDIYSIEDEISMYENAIPFASPEEAKVYETKIKQLTKKANRLRKQNSVRNITRAASLDEMDARGVKNGRKFGQYYLESEAERKEREEGREAYESEYNRLDNKESDLNYKLEETRTGLTSREKKSLNHTIASSKKKLAEVEKELSNPNISEENKKMIKNSINKLKKEVKSINKKLSKKDISEEEAVALKERLDKINKEIEERSAKLINPDLDEKRLGELNESKTSLESAISGAKSRLKAGADRLLLTNDERDNLRNNVSNMDSYIRHNKETLRNGNLTAANIKIIEETIAELEAKKAGYLGKLNKASKYTVEDRDKFLLDRSKIRNAKKDLDKQYWGKQNDINFNAVNEMFGLGMSGQDVENKGFGDYFFRSNRFKNNLSDKMSNLLNIMNNSKDENGNITDQESAKKYHEYNKLKKWYNNMTDVYGTGLFNKRDDIPQKAYGGEITKTGIAAVSEGELIIPSEFNPYYKGSNNKLSQLAKENQAKKNFAGFLDSLKNLRADKVNKFNDAGLNSTQNVDNGIANTRVVDLNGYRESKTQSQNKKKTGTSDEEAAPPLHEIFSRDKINDMIEMINAGNSVADVAKKYGCSENDVIYNINNAKSGSDKIGARIGNSLKSLTTVMSNLLEQSGLKEAAGELADTITESKREYEVTDEDKKKLYEEMYSDVAKGKDKYIPAMIGGGLTGAGISLITGAVGGPLLGAAVGAATNLVTKSDKVKDWLFGDYDENHERKGNILSKSLSNNIEKYLPSMAKSATVGGILGILPFTPGGVVSGIVMGSALGFAKKSEKVQQFIFGNDEDEESGLISKKTRDFLQEHVPEAIIGAIGGAFFMPGPMGILGKMMIGGALGFVSQTEKFQDALFGKVNDETGKREGGLIGVLRDGFVRPLTDFGKNFAKNAKDWIKDDIINPLTSALHPLFKQGTNMAKSVFNWVGEGIASIVAPKLGGGFKFLGQRMAHRSKKILGAAGKVAGAVGRPVANMYSAPFRAIGAVGDHFRRKQIQNGDATYMTAAERNTYRNEMRDNVVYDKYNKDVYGKDENGNQVIIHRKGEIKKDEFGQNIVRKHKKPKLFMRTFNRRGLNTHHGLGKVMHPFENPDKYEQFDRDLEAMSKEDLESMRGSLDILSSKDKMTKAKDKAIDNVNDLFANQFADRLGWNNTNHIRKLLKKGNGSPESFNKIIKVINNADMSDTDRAALKNSFLQKFSEYKTVDQLQKGKGDARNKMYEKLRKMGLTDISDKTIDKYKSMVNQELKVKNKMGIKELDANQDKRHKEIIDTLKEGIEAIEHMNDPDYINKKRLENYREGARKASQKQGLFMFGITKGTDIANAKNVSMDEDGNYVYTDDAGISHVMDAYGRDAKTGEPISTPGNNYTLARRGTRLIKAGIKAPFRNFWRNTGHTFRSDFRDFRDGRNERKAGKYYTENMDIGDIEKYLGDDIKDITNSDEYANLEDYEKKELLQDLLGQRKSGEYATKHGIGKFLLGKKKKKSNKKINKLYNMNKEKLSDFFQKNNIGDGTEDLDDENVRNSLIDKYRNSKDEEDTKTVSDFMGNPVEWVKNAKGSWVQKKSSSNKLTDKIQLSLFKPIDAISNKISDIAADTKDAFNRFFHLDEEDGWGKKMLKIGGGILGVLTVAGFMPILENYWTTKVGPGLKGFWENNIYPKIEKYVAPIKPTMAKAAIGIDAAIRSIPTAIENLGNRIRGFIINDLPVIWAQKIIPFYQGGIDWIGNKAEKIAEGATTLLLNIAPKVLKGIFNGVRKWWTTDLVNIILRRNGNISSMGNGDQDDNPELKDYNNTTPDSTSGIFQNMYSSIFGETAQQTLNKTNTIASNRSIDTSLKNYYMSDGTSDYPYDDVRYSSAGMYSDIDNKSSGGIAKGSSKSSSSSNTANTNSFDQYSTKVNSVYKDTSYSDNGYLDDNTGSSTTGSTTTTKRKGKSKGAAVSVSKSGGFVRIDNNNADIPYIYDASNSYNNNYQQEGQSNFSKFSQSIYNTYNKTTNKTQVNTIDRNGNTDIEKGTPGFVGRKGKINYFDYGFETDCGYVLDKKDLIINKNNCLVYNKSTGNFIPNIFYDPDTKQFTNVPTKAAEDCYKKSMNSLTNSERYSMPDTLEEMHDEELISGYNADMSLYKNSVMLSQQDTEGKNLKVSDQETDRNINRTNKSSNALWHNFATRGVRNIIFGNTEKAVERGARWSKFGGKLAKASAVAAAGGKFTRLAGVVNGLGIKSLGVFTEYGAKGVLKAKGLANKIIGKDVVSDSAEYAAKKGARTAAKNTMSEATANSINATIEKILKKSGKDITERSVESMGKERAAKEAIQNIAKRSTEESVTKRGLKKKILDRILKSDAARNCFKDTMEEAGAEWSEKAFKELAEEMSEAIGKAAGEGLAKGSTKVALRGAATFVTGGLIKGIFAVYDFTTGWKHAITYLGLTPAVFNKLEGWQKKVLKFIAGMTNLLLGLSLVTSLIPTELIIGCAANALFKLVGVDKDTYTKMRKAAVDEIAKYNKEHGTNYSTTDTTDYVNKDKLSTKIKSAFKDFGDKVANFFGFGKSKNEKKAEKSKNDLDRSVNSAFIDGSTNSESTTSKILKDNNKLFNSVKSMSSGKKKSSAKGSGLTPTMNKILLSAKGSGLNNTINNSAIINNTKESKLSKYKNNTVSKYTYNNLAATNKDKKKAKYNIELVDDSPLLNESATGSGLPEEGNVVDLNDETVDYIAPVYTGRKSRKLSAKGSNTHVDYNIKTPTAMQAIPRRSTGGTTFLYDQYSGGASKLGKVKITKDNMYIDGVTDTERSENMIDDLIYSIALLESSLSFAGCNWEATSGGYIGVGIFQWRGGDAKNLLHDIAKVEADECKKYLGNNLYNDIIKKKNIKGKNLENEEKNAIAKLLATETGKDKQLEKAHKDAVSIVKKAKKCWSNPKVILLWGMIYKFAPMVAQDLVDDNKLSKKASINYFFTIFSNNYDLYNDNKEKWNKAYNIAMASPVIKVSDSKWDKSFVESQMSIDYNELDEGSSNPITKLYDALKQMGEAWLGIYKKDTVEATNIDTTKIDAIDGTKSTELDPYTEAQLAGYVKEIENESHYLKTRLKYVRKMLEIDQEVAIKMIDKQCPKLIKLLKWSKEGKKYIKSDKTDQKAKILNDTKLASSVNSQFSKRLNDPDVLNDTTTMSISTTRRLKGYNAFIYYYTSIGSQKDAKKLNKSKAANTFKGVFNTNFVKDILSNNEEFINKIKTFSNRKDTIKWLKEYRDQFLKDVDNAKFISNTDVMFADLGSAFEVLGNSKKGLSAKERSWDIAEAILSSLGENERKALINGLGKQYGADDFDFMLDSKNKNSGNSSQINSIYNSSPLRKTASVSSYSEWLNKNKLIDSNDNYQKYVKIMKSKLNVGTIPGVNISSAVETISGKYRGNRTYQTTNAINPYTFKKNLNKSNLDAIDKIYERAANNFYSNGSFTTKNVSFKTLAKGLFNTLTNNAMTRDDQELGKYGMSLIDNDTKGPLHDAFKQYYRLWKKIPENVGGPFIFDKDVNWNELMHARARYDVYKRRNEDNDKKNDVPTNILQKAREEYDAQYDLAKEIVANGPTNDPDIRANADNAVNRYLNKYYAGTDSKGNSLVNTTDGADYYLNSHIDKFSSKANELLGKKNYKANYDGYNNDEIKWINMNKQISFIENANKASNHGYNGMPSDVVQKLNLNSSNLNPYTTYYNKPGYAVPTNIKTINKLTNGTASAKTYKKYKQWCKVNNIDIKGKNTDTSSFNPGSDPAPIVTKITNIPGMVSASQAPKITKVKTGGAITAKYPSPSGKGSGFISQLDYGNARFADGESVAQAGCGPAVAAMAIQNLKAKESAKGSNLMAATTALANKYKNSGGTQASYFKDVMGRAGAKTSYTKSSSEIKSNLRKGEQVVLMGRDSSNKSKANSPFGPNNHYVLATGMGHGKINVSDPEQHSPRVYSDKILRNTKLGVSISGKGSGASSLTSELYSARGSKSLKHENLASWSPLSASQINKFIKRKNSKCGLVGMGKAFVKAAKESGLDPRYLVAHVAVETGWGNSNLAKNHGNMYGIGAYDANPINSDSTGKYANNNIYNGIIEGAKWIKNNYYNRGQTTVYLMRHDPKGKGHNYCTSLTWENDIANIMSQMPKNKKLKYTKKSLNSEVCKLGTTKSSHKSRKSSKSSNGGTWLEKLTSAITDSVNAFMGWKTKGSRGDSSGDSSSNGTWISTIKAVKKAFAKAGFGYKLGGSGTIKINGKSKRVRTDCSGFVTACLQVYGVKVGSLTSNSFLGSINALSKAGFKKMKWKGWGSLKKGDIIAKSGHVEIFSDNKGGSHHVWNFGSPKSAYKQGTTSDNRSYTVVWRAPSAKGSGLLLPATSSIFSAKGSDTSETGSMSDIVNNSSVFNYLKNRDNNDSSEYKVPNTSIEYDNPSSSKSYKSINKYIKDNGIKLSSEAMKNVSKKSGYMSDIINNSNRSSSNRVSSSSNVINSSGKGSGLKKGNSSGKITSTDEVINKSINYIQTHKISGTGKNSDNDDIKVLLHAILSLEAVTANNSYDINTIVKLLKKIVDNTKESKSSKSSSGKGSSIKPTTVNNTVKSNIPSKEEASTIINTVNSSTNNSNNISDNGLSELISNLQYIVSK